MCSHSSSYISPYHWTVPDGIQLSLLMDLKPLNLDLFEVAPRCTHARNNSLDQNYKLTTPPLKYIPLTSPTHCIVLISLLLLQCYDVVNYHEICSSYRQRLGALQPSIFIGETIKRKSITGGGVMCGPGGVV